MVYAFFLLIISAGTAGVNDLAHIGGLAFGLLVGYYCYRQKTHDEYSVKYSQIQYAVLK